MSGQHTVPSFPRLPLYSAVVLIAFSLGAVTWVRLTLPAHPPAPAAHILAERSITVTDQADGSVLVTDAATGNAIGKLAVDGDAFARVTLRTLAERRGKAPALQHIPFELTAWSSGGLTLVDPATGETIELESFGHTNAGRFAELLAAPETPR
jgi:putative photosynthetic complex assembly protein